MTNDIEQAQDWIRSRFNGTGEILIFQVDEDVFDNYKGKTFKGSNKKWRDYVFDNRNGFSSMQEHYDYVEGPYLANPTSKAHPSDYKAKGHQVAIKNTNLAREIFAGFIGSYSISK